jgi:hypothetical protein
VEKMVMPSYVEMKFRYHEPWFEIDGSMPTPRSELIYLSRDKEFIRNVIERVFIRTGSLVEPEKLDNITTKILEGKITFNYKWDYSKEKRLAVATINFKEVSDLPVSFEEFGVLFCKFFYTEADTVINTLLKEAATKGLMEEYSFYRELNEDIRILEEDSIKRRIKLYRFYINDVAIALGLIGEPVYYPPQKEYFRELDQQAFNTYIAIFLVLLFTFIPLLIKLFLVSIHRLIVKDIRPVLMKEFEKKD